MSQLPAARPKLYGRRKGKTLSPLAKDLRDKGLKHYGIDESIVEGVSTLNPEAFFPIKYHDYWLEVGFGGGEHLIALAKQNPQIGFIGCEVFENGVAKFARELLEQKIENVRIYSEDARHVLQALKPQTLGRVYLMFPDPWPKKRHIKRRFVNPDNLDLLVKVLKPGMQFRVATDHPVYAPWVKEQMEADVRFQPLYPGIWHTKRPADWFETRYETKAIGWGHTCHYMAFVKI